MNRQQLNALINKRMQMSGVSLPEEVDEYSQYNEYEPQNLAADWFDQPEWKISKGEAADKRYDMSEDMGMAGMGAINKISSMLAPEAKLLREALTKRNALENAGKELGKLIKVEGGGLNDIRQAQRDFGSKRGNLLDETLMKIRRGEIDVSEEQIPQVEKLIREYNSYTKDSYYDDLIDRLKAYLEPAIDEPVIEEVAKVIPYRKK